MRILPAALGTIACALALGTAACQGRAEPAERAEDAARSVVAEPADQQSARPAAPTSARSDLLVSGTIFWGRFLEDWSDASPQGERYPFQRLDEFHPERYDAWIAGLECPSVAGDRMGSGEQDRLLSFNCDPRFLPEAARWFTAVSLANNHTDNRGRAGVEETRRHLHENGIQAFGDPDPTRLDDVCSVVTVATRVRRDDGSRATGLLPVAMCGYHGVFQIPPEAAVAQVARYAAYLPTFALPHSGLEYVATPDSIKVDLYRDLVDAGADAVLGDHPHWVQNAEAWHGRLIVYSLGNFVFDQQGDPERTRAASVHVRLDVADDTHLATWLELGETCARQAGDCLAEIENAHLPRMRFTLGYDVVGSVNPDRVTRPATPAEEAGIRDRLHWEEAMAGLRGRYGPMAR
jgi:poly-gamma-glutamate synthesis protein (capsule biosynthesis protein)